MPWGAAIAAVGTIASGAMSAKGAKDAARSGTAAQMAAIDEQRRQFDISRQDQMPWLDAGREGLDRMRAAMNGDFSSFQNSPDYQFAYDQGLKAVQRGQPGNFFGGGQSADLVRFGQGLASQQYGNWWNRNAGLAGLGQTAGQGLGALGQNYANSYQTAMGNIGDMRASSITNQANIWNNVAGRLGNIASAWMNRPQDTSSAPQWSSGSGNLWSNQASTGQGSIYNFGNNVGNLAGWGR